MDILMLTGLAVWWIARAHLDATSHVDLLQGRKLKSVTLSTVEAEYIVTCMAYCEVTWLQKLFSELFEHVLDATVILSDN